MLLNKLSPNATTQIRMDHTHVLSVFHSYRPNTSPRVKQGIVNTICLALEVHAKLEEEIFYPAMRAVSENEAIRKAVPEHDEMKRLIADLRGMESTDARYDDTLMELMRDVLHHVADEETIILPEAERLLRDRLGELGAQMTKRRLELIAPRAGDLALNMVKAAPVKSFAVLAGVVVGGLWLGKRWMRPARRGLGQTLSRGLSQSMSHGLGQSLAHSVSEGLNLARKAPVTRRVQRLLSK